MRNTEGLGLALYDPQDKFNITGETDSLNNNMELIDEAVTRKVNKVTSAVAGNFPAFGSDGILVDSEYSGTDIETCLLSLETKGNVVPLAYYSTTATLADLETDLPAASNTGAFAYISAGLNTLYVSRQNTWTEIETSTANTYVYSGRIFFADEGGLLTEVVYLRDLDAVAAYVISKLPIYNGEVETE